MESPLTDSDIVVATKALEVAETTYGLDHPDVAESLDNLAVLYDAQGDYERAEPLCKRSLAIREKALGLDHPDVARSLCKLAWVYFHQNNNEQAEPLFLRCLAIREKALGPDHPDVAKSLDDLALLYKAQGQYKEAERLYQRSSEGKKALKDEREKKSATEPPAKHSGTTESIITAEWVADAHKALKAYIARRKKNGEKVKVLEQPYYEGLNNIRCVLSVDGERTRIYYQPGKGSWRKASYR